MQSLSLDLKSQLLFAHSLRSEPFIMCLYLYIIILVNLVLVLKNLKEADWLSTTKSVNAFTTKAYYYAMHAARDIHAQ